MNKVMLKAYHIRHSGELKLLKLLGNKNKLTWEYLNI